MKNNKNKSAKVRPASVYLVLSLQQIRAMAQLAEKQLAGRTIADFSTVTISANLSEAEHDNDSGAAQLASYSVAIEGANLNQFTYASPSL